MSPRPKAPIDLALAPVAAEVDMNLQRLRRRPAKEIEFELELELDRGPVRDDRDERAERVLLFALRNVNRHGWEAAITDDHSAVRLSGGSVSLDIAVGASVMSFIEGSSA